MENKELIITAIIGGIFLILGVISFLWGKSETGGWYRSIQEHRDVREYVEHTPSRPEPMALKIGGKICFALSIVILLVALGIYVYKYWL